MTTPTHDEPPAAGWSSSSDSATEHGDGAAAAGPPAADAPGTIGRFAVLRRLGAGGMGVVYSAYDENLDRRVAIKLLHADEAPGSRGQTRLQREAQAMARLSHPNVVQVYEVGEHAGRVFIAMEFVKGCTAKQWLLQRPRRWQQVVHVYAQAGEGLAAAHAAGLTHRDFKPENVLVGSDDARGDGVGRVRVVDFGLARTASTDPAATTDTFAPQVGRSGSVLADDITQAGALVGTPAYMSPEQYRQQPGDARSDQFSFCVALYEGLYGCRPFDGPNRVAVGMAIMHGDIRDPPEDADVPGWLHKAVVRGLSSDPSDRWPDMRSLLEALQPRRDASRRSWIALLGTGAVAISTLAFVLGRDAGDGPCTGGPDRLATVWNERREAELDNAIRTTSSGLAEQTAQRLLPAVQRYGDRWLAMYRDACEATEIRGEQSQDMLDRRVACLDERLRQLDATVEVLVRADEKIVENALEAVARLPQIEPCGDRAALLSGVDPPSDPETAATVETLRTALAQVRALRNAGKTAEANDAAESLRERVEAARYPPLTAQMLYTVGQIGIDLGEHARAVETLQEAHWTALQARDDRTAFEAASLLAHVVGDLEEDYDTGMRWWRTADALLSRLGGEGGMDRAWLFSHRGTINYKRAAYDEAASDLDRAIAIAESHDPADPKALASFINNRANVELAREDMSAAEAMYQRALALREELFGPVHPSHVSSLANLSGVFHKTGRDARAVEVLQRAAKILEASENEDSVRAGHVQANLSIMFEAVGRKEEARAASERAREIYRTKLGPDHPNLGMMLINYGASQYDDGDYEAGLETMKEALRIFERSVGPDHPNAAHARVGVADGLSEAGDHATALTMYEQALAAWEKIHGPDHPRLAAALLGIGRAHLELGHPRSAIESLERALTLHEDADDDAPQLADIRFALARALWAVQSERDRARKLAEQARDTYASDPDLVPYADEIDAWLRKPG